MMKFNRRQIIFSLLTFFFLLFLPFQALAQTNLTEKPKIVTLGKNEVVNKDYFAAGEKVTLDGIVNGDAYIAGGQIDINGTINGDLLVAGGQINIRGTVSQNIRVIGGNIIISGKIGKNLSVACGSLTVEKTAKAGGNMVVAGGKVEILTQVNNLTVGGGMVNLGGNVLGNAMVGAGTLTILPEVSIKGNLEYWSENEATIAQDTKITGQTAFHQTQFQKDFQKNSEKKTRGLSGLNNFMFALGLVSVLLLGILFIKFLPVYTLKTAEVVQSKFWVCLLVGFVVLVITPILAIVLMITLIGFPIGLGLIFLYSIVFYLGKLFAILAMGKYLGEKAKWNLTPVWAFVVGLLLYFLLSLIPFVGWLTKMVVTLAGVGALIFSKKSYYSTLREKELI